MYYIDFQFVQHPLSGFIQAKSLPFGCTLPTEVRNLLAESWEATRVILKQGGPCDFKKQFEEAKYLGHYTLYVDFFKR